MTSANQFYQTGNSVREQASGALLPAQTCAACGTAIGLCYSNTSADDVCCIGCTYTSYSSSVVNSTRGGACGLSQTATYYHNGSGTTPVVNNFVYSDSSGQTLLGVGYYSLSATSVIYVNNNDCCYGNNVADDHYFAPTNAFLNTPFKSINEAVPAAPVGKP